MTGVQTGALPILNAFAVPRTHNALVVNNAGTARIKPQPPRIGFWEELKKFRVVKASLEGINSASAGMVIAATFVLFDPIEANLINTLVIVFTFILLAFSKVPAPLIILGGFAAGLIF